MEHFIKRLSDNIPSDATKIAVAFSGGADSLALLVALSEISTTKHFKLIALHCNFHLRGNESDADTSFCENVASALNIKLFVRHFRETPELSKATGESTEMICRRLRYDWFDDYISQGYYIALGHHIEDNRETVLLNLLRGTGIKGLKGMEITDADRKLMRPMLGMTKEDITDFLTLKGYTWQTDSSNLVADVKRNRLRLNVIPAIAKDFPTSLQNLDKTIANIHTDYTLFKELLDELCTKVIDSITGTIHLSLLKSITSVPDRVLFEILSPLGFNYSQCTDILNTTEGWNEFKSPKGVLYANSKTACYYDRDTVENFSEDKTVSDSLVGLCSAVTTLELQEIISDNTLKSVKDILSDANPGTILALDADALDNYSSRKLYTWRPIATGDRMTPFGMKKGSRLISDILTDMHASPPQKMSARVLMYGNDILWLAPFKTSALFPVTETTRRAYIITEKNNRKPTNPII